MIPLFLKAKHWHLFLLLFVVPTIYQQAIINSVISTISNEANPDPSELLNTFSYLPIILMLSVGVLFGWLWSIAIGLQYKIPQNIRLNTNSFKIFFFIPLLYMIFIIFSINSIFQEITQEGVPFSNGLDFGMIKFIIPLHLLSMFGIFYAIYIAAKTLKTIELKRKVHFSDFVSEFFLIWFYFVGVWVIQPKINEIAKEENTVSL